jgi:hypothetical protein
MRLTEPNDPPAPDDTAPRVALTVTEAEDRLTALLARFAYLAALADRDGPDDPPEAA